MELRIESSNNTFDLDVTPVLLQGNEQCECCTQIGAGIHETIDFDGGVLITNSDTGHNATADFEIGDSELTQVKKAFITKTREELVAVMLHYKKISSDTGQKILDNKKELFCCDNCRDEYHRLTVAILNQDS